MAFRARSVTSSSCHACAPTHRAALASLLTRAASTWRSRARYALLVVCNAATLAADSAWAALLRSTADRGLLHVLDVRGLVSGGVGTAAAATSSATGSVRLPLELDDELTKQLRAQQKQQQQQGRRKCRRALTGAAV